MSLTTTSQDFHNPLYQQLPANAHPTEVLATRFAAWRSIIKGLILYLKDVIAIHEESVLQQVRLQHSIANNFPLAVAQGTNPATEIVAANGAQPSAQNNTPDEIANIKKVFLPLGYNSILDVPNALNEFHKTVGTYTTRTLKELSLNVIPRLEDLRRDLSIKVKEIKNLSSDFKSSITKEVAQTKTELGTFYSLIDQIKSVNNLQPKNDPYLTKIYLDKQIKQQLLEEKYLHEAFLNIQSSGKELEKLVVMELQNSLKIYARLIGEESQVIFNVLIPKLDNGFVTRPGEFEWDAFIKQNPYTFISTDLKVRKFADISYKYINDPLTLEIRSSFLERRLKFLKSYSRSWYVLTPTFIHEFKSGDRKKDVYPIMSLSLDECQVAEHSKKDTNNPNSWHKFVLHTKQNGIIHRGHNWVFRAETYDLMISWYNDIKKLTQLPTPEARSHYIAEKMELQKRRNSFQSSVNQSKTSLKRLSTLSQIQDSPQQNLPTISQGAPESHQEIPLQPEQISQAVSNQQPIHSITSTIRQPNIAREGDLDGDVGSHYIQHQRSVSYIPQQPVYYAQSPGNLQRSFSINANPNHQLQNPANNSQILVNRLMSMNGGSYFPSSGPATISSQNYPQQIVPQQIVPQQMQGQPIQGQPIQGQPIQGQPIQGQPVEYLVVNDPGYQNINVAKRTNSMKEPYTLTPNGNHEESFGTNAATFVQNNDSFTLNN